MTMTLKQFNKYVKDNGERPKNIVQIPISERTEKEHRQIMKWFYNDSVRNYLLSMGKFKPITI